MYRLKVKSKNKKLNKKFRRLKAYLGLGLITVMLIKTPYFTRAYAEENTKSEESNTEVYYVGKVTALVNVRIGAGEKNDKLVHNNKNVQLKKGETVTILNEVDVNGKPWYFVRFERDGETLEGYATSSYITKTKETIEPTMTPEPTPTKAPTKVPTPISILEPTKVPAVTEPSSQEEESGNTILLVIIVLGITGTISALCFILYKRRNKTTDNEEMIKAVQKLKETNPEGVKKEKDSSNKKPIIKPAKKDVKKLEQEEDYIHEVYVKESKEQRFKELPKYMTEDQRKETAAKETAEKKALRAEIESLREHDFVEHKYFGKGEVYDNSDVKLIEIRFGNDVRFLNKDTLALKKLLKKSDEVNRMWRY